MDTELIEVPVPDVIEQAPDDIIVTLNDPALSPEVSRREARELLKVCEDFLKVR